MTALAIGSFATAEPFRRAIGDLRQAERAIVGIWSPIPVDIPDTPVEASRGIVPAMAVAGAAFAAGLYLLIWWSATIAYPFNEGGRPLNSWPAFLVAPIEFGALLAGIAGLITFLWRARLTRLHDAAFAIDEVSGGTSDRFVLAIRCDAGSDANGLLAMLGEAGAVHTRLLDQR